jgi:predicted TPR repeat methyltransferase
VNKKRRKTSKRRGTRSGSGALDSAIALHQSGELAAATQAYRQIIDLRPDDVQALYLCGVATAQLGQQPEAIGMLRKAVALQPDHFHAIAELARQLQAAGEYQASADALRKLIAMQPELGALYSNLGFVLQQLGRPDEALVACQQGVELNTDCAEAHANLGDVLKELQRYDQACASYRRAIELNPRLIRVYRSLSAVLRSCNRLEEAVEVMRQWSDHEPDNPVVRHMLAATSGKNTPSRASDEYVQSVFDKFSESFNDDLASLDYRAPRLIGEALDAEWGAGVGGLDILDAGCGTGLCAPVLRPLARRLVGVDLSAGMIQQAGKLRLYDDLVHCELQEYLNRHPGAFDLIVAADTFNYFGDLGPLLSAAASGLRPAGVLVFTLEKGGKSALLADYQLHPHGRYSHNEDYARRCLGDCGMEIGSIDPAVLRRERNQPVAGIIVRARKCGNGSGERP